MQYVKREDVNRCLFDHCRILLNYSVVSFNPSKIQNSRFKFGTDWRGLVWLVIDGRRTKFTLTKGKGGVWHGSVDFKTNGNLIARERLEKRKRINLSRIKGTTSTDNFIPVEAKRVLSPRDWKNLLRHEVPDIAFSRLEKLRKQVEAQLSMLIPTSRLKFQCYSIQEIEINLDLELPVGHDIALDPQARVNLAKHLHGRRRSVYHDQDRGRILGDRLIMLGLEDIDIVSGVPGLGGEFEDGTRHKEYLKQISKHGWLQRCEWQIDNAQDFRNAARSGNSFTDSWTLKRLLRRCYVAWHSFLFETLNQNHYAGRKDLRDLAERLIEQYLPFRSLSIARALLDEGCLSIRARALVRSGTQLRNAMAAGLLRKQGRTHYVLKWEFVQQMAKVSQEPQSAFATCTTRIDEIAPVN